MSAITRLLKSHATNGAICLLSASLFAVAVSNYLRPTPVSAQAGTATRKTMTGESRSVITALQDAFVSLADTVEPSVVTIEARATQVERPNRPKNSPDGEMNPFGGMPLPFRDFPFPFGRDRGAPDGEGRGTSTGSGVIVRETGNTVFVLTNNHVVNSRDRFRVRLHSGQEYTAEFVGKDERTDLAVLKFQVSAPLPGNSVAKLGSSDSVKVGQWAVAIGSPLGYDSTLTVGVISAKGRSLSGFGRGSGADYSDLLQTDASINPGNSGGPLVNIEGEVIGINVAIASNGTSQGSIGIGFAIPSNTAKMVSEQIISRGKVVRGYLGIACSEGNKVLAPELRDHLGAPSGGALAETVQPETPASRAGVQEGDVIVRFGEREVRNFAELTSAVASTSPGVTVPIEVIRNGKPVRLRLTVVERPSEAELEQRLGNAPRTMPAPPTGEGTRTRFGFSARPGKDGKGVEIVSLAPDGPAAEAGLQPGDVILKAGPQVVNTVDGLTKAIDSATGRTGVVLHVQTSGGMRFVVFRP